MFKIKYLFILSLFFNFLSVKTSAQNPTIGLIYQLPSAYEGYTLFTPENSNNVYLINNCGEKIKEWTFNELPGLTCYLLENGNLLRAGKDSIQIKDWNDNLIWSYATTINGIKQHHDIEPLPNGNILCIAADTYAKTEMTAAGRNPSITNANFKLEKIIEPQPIGTNDAAIVWEWKFFDHLIQDFDNTKANYGDVNTHPELIDINYDNGYPSDWIHLNGIDYNPLLDQIIISARHLNEIYIVDHSTTSLEAASHSGGNSNKGGDLLWRWGNPQVYRQGNANDQKLFLQHDSKFVEQGFLDEGKITVFNNDGDGTNTFSSVHLITPVISSGDYQLQSGKFLPADFEWTFDGSTLGTSFHEENKSGTHSLPNGNMMICESSIGRVSEINKNGDVLWSYKNPVGSVVYNQFSTIPLGENGIFRAEKYPADYAAFIGETLTPMGIIEDQNLLSDSCSLSVSVNEKSLYNDFEIISPSTHQTIKFSREIAYKKLSIIDLGGRIVFSKNNFKGNYLQVALIPSIYFIQFESENNLETKKIIVH